MFAVPSDLRETMGPGMDRDQLKRWLDQGLSLPQIGVQVNRDPSTVGYWVHKYGLAANGRSKHAPKGGLTREQLKPLVEAGLNPREIGETVGRSANTVRYWLKHHELTTRRRSMRAEVEAALADGSRTVHGLCRRHGETEFAVVGSELRLRCKKCRAEAVSRRRRKIKQILVEEAGGRCHLCGYAGHVAALEFHHLDPSTKSFGVARRGITRSIEKVRAEAAKCLLLCANCHAEVGAGVTPVP